MIRVGALPHTLTVLVPTTTTDRYGDEVVTVDVNNPSNTTIKAFVQPVQAGEATNNRDAVQYQYIAFTNNPVDARTQVVFDGHRLEVDGEPLRWDSPRGNHHFELRLKVWEG